MENKVICGARTRKGTACQRQALKDSKRCRLHGGLSTGPKNRELKGQQMKGNKNAVKTGEFETISYDTLSTEEKELYEQVPEDAATQVKGRYRIIEIRTRRIMKLYEEEWLKDKPNIKRIMQLEGALTRLDPRALELINEMKELAAGENSTDGSLDKLVEIIQQHRASR